jgi:hypothetical protein
VGVLDYLANDWNHGGSTGQRAQSFPPDPPSKVGLRGRWSSSCSMVVPFDRVCADFETPDATSGSTG